MDRAKFDSDMPEMFKRSQKRAKRKKFHSGRAKGKSGKGVVRTPKRRP